MSGPTPRPWEHFVEIDVSYNSRTGEKMESINHWVRAPDKTNVAIAARLFQLGEFNHKTAEANAAHIVKCVNLHDELVEALIACQKIVLAWQHGAIGYDEAGRSAMREAVSLTDLVLAKAEAK